MTLSFRGMKCQVFVSVDILERVAKSTLTVPPRQGLDGPGVLQSHLL